MAGLVRPYIPYKAAMGSMSEADGKGAYLLTSTYLVLVFFDIGLLNMSESSM